MAIRHRLTFAAIEATGTKREPDLVTPLTITPPAWMADALCPQVDTAIFFPDRGGSTKEAKSVCARCRVRNQCLDYALEFDSSVGAVQPGIYGGLSPQQRRRLLREQGRSLTTIPCAHDCGRMFASNAAVGRHRRECALAPQAAS